MNPKTHESLCVLVNSCDKYDDLWKPFFELMAINWPDLKYPIYLNTETKEFICSIGTREVTALHCPDPSAAWSERLYQSLKRIPEEYVLMLMDDYFLVDKVKSSEIDSLLEWMKADKKIANVVLYSVGSHGTVSESNPRVILLDKKEPNLVTCCTAAIWRKEILISLIRRYESPWEFEEAGTQRAYKKDWKHYALSPEGVAEHGLIYPFRLAPVHGIGVLQGKWGFNNKALFHRFGIEADFSKRESWSSYEEVQTYFSERAKQNEEENPLYKRVLHRILPDAAVGIVRRLRRKSR